MFVTYQQKYAMYFANFLLIMNTLLPDYNTLF